VLCSRTTFSAGARSLAFLALVTGAATTVASADPVGWSTSGEGSVSWVTTQTPGVPTNPITVCEQSPACVGSVAVLNASGLTMSYNNGGSADIGVLHAYVNGSVSGTPGGTPPLYAIMIGSGEFEDTLTVSGLPTGSTGSMVLDFSIDGTQTLSGSNVGGLDFLVYDYNANGSYLDSQVCVDDTLSSPVTCPALTFKFGVPMILQVYFQVGTNLADFVPGSVASMDYNNTAVLSGILITNPANQNQPVDFTVASASGAVYTSSGVAPEPSSFALMALAAVAFVAKLVMRYVRTVSCE